MDWFAVALVLGLAALLGGRLCLGLWFEGSWLNACADNVDDWICGDGTGDEGSGGGDGGGD